MRRGDALCELITEKTTFELPAEAEGILRRIVAGEKSIVPVGYIIGILGDFTNEVPDVEAENLAVTQRKKQTPEAAPDTLSVPAIAAPSAAASPSAGGAGSRVRATPAARRAARDRGVAIEDVAVAFPGKVLSEDDVAKFAPPQ